MSGGGGLPERLRQIAESYRMDLRSPSVAATLDEAADALESSATPPLPTEAGIYLGLDRVADCSILVIVEEGTIYLPNAARHAGIGSVLGDPERFAPFTRLEPVPVTATRIRDAVREAYQQAPATKFFMTIVDEVAAEFGVQP